MGKWGVGWETGESYNQERETEGIGRPVSAISGH